MDTEPESCVIRIRPSTVCAALLFAIAALLLLHVAVHGCWRSQACGSLTAIINNYGYQFDLNAEANVPTWYSAMQLSAVALAVTVAAYSKFRSGEQSARWWGLAILFGYLSLDEATDMHALWIVSGSEIFLREGYDWMIPGLVIVLVIVSYYLRWVLRLTNRTRNLFLVAGATYVGGGMGLELLGALTADESFSNIEYFLVSTAEETLEMVAIVIMLYAVLGELGRVTVRFTP